MAMDRDAILGDLRARVAARVYVAATAVDVTVPMVDGLGLPSIELLELLLEIEEAYTTLDLEDPRTQELTSLTDLANWLATQDV
jgi:acyl carrier protein